MKRELAQSPFAEGYENLKTYTKRGKYKDTYLAFVRYDMKIKDIYTMAPDWRSSI